MSSQFALNKSAERNRVMEAQDIVTSSDNPPAWVVAAQRKAWRRFVRNVDDPIISNADLTKILCLTKVPVRRHRIVRTALLVAISTAHGSTAHQGGRRRSRLETLSLQAVARRAQALHDAIDRLAKNQDKSASDFFWRWAACDDEEDEFDLSELQSRLETLTESCDRQSSPRSKKPPHRPPGTVQHPALRFTITKLHEAIEAQGRGELSLWRDAASGKWKGTVPPMLAILRGCLPLIVPANLPYATLRRVLSDVASNGDGRGVGAPAPPHFKKP
jgi:hypothetical protein